MINKIKIAVFLGFTMIALFPVLTMLISFVLYPAPHTVSQAMESIGLSTTLLVVGLWINQLITQIEGFIGTRRTTRPTPRLPARMTKNDIKEMVRDAVREIYEEAIQDEEQREEEPDKDEVEVTSTRPEEEV